MNSKIISCGIVLLALALLQGCVRAPVKLKPAKPEVKKVILVDISPQQHTTVLLS